MLENRSTRLSTSPPLQRPLPTPSYATPSNEESKGLPERRFLGDALPVLAERDEILVRLVRPGAQLGVLALVDPSRLSEQSNQSVSRSFSTGWKDGEEKDVRFPELWERRS